MLTLYNLQILQKIVLNQVIFFSSLLRLFQGCISTGEWHMLPYKIMSLKIQQAFWKLQANINDEHRCKNPQQNTSKQNPIAH